MFNVLYGNARSVINKINELKVTVADLNPDFVFLSESWSNEQIEDVYLKIPGYELICRKDRTDTTNGIGGGLLIYAKSGVICAEHVLPVFEEFNQCCSVKIPLPNKSELVLVLVYRPHKLYKNTIALDLETRRNNAKLCNVIRQPPHPCVLIGDFNYSCIDWELMSSSANSKDFLDTVQNCFLEQHIDFPTHISGSTPDLVLSSSPGLVLGVEDVGRLGASDHSMVLVTVPGQLPNNVTFEEVPDWNRADMEALRAELCNVNWDEYLRDLDAENSWIRFKERLQQAEDRCVPRKRRRVGNNPIWMKKNIIRVVRKKRRLWKRYKVTKDYEEYLAYKRVEKEVRNIVKNAKKRFEKKLAKEAKKNPKRFYAYMKSNTSNRQSVGPLKEGNTIVTDDTKMSNILNSFFSSVFTDENLINIPDPERIYSGHEPLTSVTFLQDKVKEKIDKLKASSAAGPDKFYPRTLKEISDFICHPLTIIFTRSLKEGIVPEDWRKANVAPIFKSGTKSTAGNYRPISLTCVLCKVMESIIRDQIVIHLTANHLIKPSQHGFMANKSCLTNLLEYLEVLTCLVDAGHNVDVVYMDFAKAFDKVPHQRLLRKIAAHGIEGSVLQWISAWLCGRKQRVVLNGSSSEWADVKSGVPQGSVLGPTLFVIFINDIDAVIDIVNGFISKFADDTKCGRVVLDDDDRQALQNDINKLLEWAETWQMEFNYGKCKVLHLGRSNPGFSYTMGGHAPAGTVLEAVDSEKDIGVIIHESLKPSAQCAKSAKKANQVLGQMSRCFHYRDKSTWIGIYKMYVRPHLEFAVQAWSPWTRADKDLLESVQKRAVRMMSGVTEVSYEDRLKLIGLTTLEARRLRGDMIEVWKILHGKDDVNADTWFTMSKEKHSRVTRNTENALIIAKPLARLEIRHNFFSSRVVDPWNYLPESLKNSSSIDVFKAGYDSLFLTG